MSEDEVHKQPRKLGRGSLLGDTLVKHQHGVGGDMRLSQGPVMILPPLAIVNTLSAGLLSC